MEPREYQPARVDMNPWKNDIHHAGNGAAADPGPCRCLTQSFIRWLLLPQVLAAVLLLTGCSAKIGVTRYFLLEYQPATTNAALKAAGTLPYRVQVLTFKIPRSFDSIRIIARYSSHQINYYRYSLWAVRPQVAVADLLVQHINSYGLFRDCQREFLDERPDYEISGEILQIERFESEAYAAAHLRMSLVLTDYNSGDKLVEHAFDREVPVPSLDMTIFAKAVSDIVAAESEAFLEKVAAYFAAPAGQ